MDKKLLLVVVCLSVFILAVLPLQGWSQLVSTPYNNDPRVVDDTNFATERYSEGIEFPSCMAFLGPDDILVLEKNAGQVRRIVKGAMLKEPLLDLSVAVKDERGLLGIAVNKDNRNDTTFLFLYYTESSRDGDDLEGIDPLRNCLYRHELIDGKLVNGKLLLDLPASTASNHNRGRITIDQMRVCTSP